jgi:hypothetical protein
MEARMRREKERVSWSVTFHEDFEPEFWELPKPVRVELAASMVVLRENGPLLGRPKVDTLKGSDHANMKELRLVVNGEPWRIAFAFDPHRKAVLLVAGKKAGIAKERFYRNLIRVADSRYERHLKSLGGEWG